MKPFDERHFMDPKCANDGCQLADKDREIAALREALKDAWLHPNSFIPASVVIRHNLTALLAIAPAPDPAEDMRAKCAGNTSACWVWEPIEGTHLAKTCRGSGQCLSALKGNGEGRAVETMRRCVAMLPAHCRYPACGCSEPTYAAGISTPARQGSHSGAGNGESDAPDD